MSEPPDARLRQAVQALVLLVRDEWPVGLSLEEIAMRGHCSDEQVQALRSLEAGELSLSIAEQAF